MSAGVHKNQSLYKSTPDGPTHLSLSCGILDKQKHGGEGLRLPEAVVVVGSIPLLIVVSILDNRRMFQERSPSNPQFKYPMKSLCD